MSQIAGATHIGNKRRENQDRFIITNLESGPVLAAVADGVGGHAGGAIAAQVAVDSLLEELISNPDDLKSAFFAACKTVEQAAAGDSSLAYMGTTLTAALLHEDRMEWSHLGDTRLYLFRDGILSRLTRDDTVAEDLVEQGHLDEKEAMRHPTNHILHEWLGCGECEPSSGQKKLLPGDLIMISSDGLHGELTKEKISAVLANSGSLESMLITLIEEALKAGGHDNISIVLAAI